MCNHTICLHKEVDKKYTGYILKTKESLGCVLIGIALDKMRFSVQKVLIFFLFLHKNIYYGYSLEAPHQNTSNEYPQHVFMEKEEYLPDTHSYRGMW